MFICAVKILKEKVKNRSTDHIAKSYFDNNYLQGKDCRNFTVLFRRNQIRSISDYIWKSKSQNNGLLQSGTFFKNLICHLWLKINFFVLFLNCFFAKKLKSFWNSHKLSSANLLKIKHHTTFANKVKMSNQSQFSPISPPLSTSICDSSKKSQYFRIIVIIL